MESSNSDIPSSSEHSRVEALYTHIQALIHNAHNNIVRSVNSEMVNAYWLIGKAIVEEEQHGADRAKYGIKLIKTLAGKLSSDLGKGFGVSNLKYIKQFYLTYSNGSKKFLNKPIGHALRGQLVDPDYKPTFNPNLSWMHFRVLCKVQDDNGRSFYEVEAINNRWSYSSF